MNNYQIISQLQNICGENNILTADQILSSYLTDWRKRYSGSAVAVALPTSTRQVQQLVQFCQSHSIAITPQGGNTSTCGSATPLTTYPRPQIIINLAKMNKVIEVNIANQSILVEAGITLSQLHATAKLNGGYFPLTLASQDSCQIGGNLATNAGGIQVLKYGMMRDLTLGLEAVLASGEIFDVNYKLRKNNSYLDLKHLIIGSEGTLGIITRATLKLYTQPQALFTFMLGATKLHQAIKLLHELRQQYSNNVSAFEIIKTESQHLYNQHFAEQKLPLSAEWLIIGEIETNAEFSHQHFSAILVSLGVDLEQVIVATTSSQRLQLWNIREKIPVAEKAHGFAVKHDISLPLDKIEEFLALNMPKLKRLRPNGYFSIFGHLGDGNLHYNYGLVNATHAETNLLEQVIAPVVYTDVISLGGSIAAEHGIGQAKKEWFKQFSRPINYHLLRTIKQQLDPHNIFNPGKIF